MLLDLIDNKGQDFIDFDIEGSPFDNTQWTAFAARFNDSLQRRQSHNTPSVPPFIVLTVGADRARGKIASEPDVAIINIMSYDNLGSWWGQIVNDCAVTSWSNINGTGTNLDPMNYAGQGGKAFVSMQEDARLVRNAGWPAEKIIVGADHNPSWVTGGTFPDGRGPTRPRKVWTTVPSFSGSGLKFYLQWPTLATIPRDSIVFDPISHVYWAHTGTSLATDRLWMFTSFPGYDSSVYYMRRMADSMNIGGIMVWNFCETYGTGTSKPSQGWGWLSRQYEKYFGGNPPPPPPPPDVPKIKGGLFFDQDQDRVRDAGEPPVAGWRITLNGPANDTVLTDSAGSFSFNALPLGNYTVTLQQKSGWSRTLPAAAYTYSIGVDSVDQTTTSDFGIYSATAFGFTAVRNWNIISVPVTVSDLSVDNVFPLGVTTAYAFHAEYLQRDVLENGEGYWIKFNTGHTVWLSGTPRQTDTTTVSQGWNFLGSVSSPVAVSNLRSIPPGILSPYVYGYDRGSFLSDTIYPGKGYWISTTQAGKVIISTVPAGGAEGGQALPTPPSRLNRITFESASGETENLYFSLSAMMGDAVSGYPAPPSPPGGSFAARFRIPGGSEGDASVISIPAMQETPVSVPIRLQGAAYPLVVSWEMQPGAGVVLEGLDGLSGLRQMISGSGSAALTYPGSPADGSGGSSLRLVVGNDAGAEEVPSGFALEQNFPNPFNSGTQIRFSIPVESRVTLEVFNVLGEIVMRLGEIDLPAGYHTFPVEMAGLASGTYVYRLRAEGGGAERFTAAKKFLYLR
jgi:hypothetical protein